MTQPSNASELHAVRAELSCLEQDALQLEQQHSADLLKVPETRRASARNLVHYLAIRQHDLRPLQVRLGALGLSSLGRLEANVVPSLRRVENVISTLLHEPSPTPSVPACTEGRSLVENHTDELLGPRPERRGVRVMVTMPSEAATDAALIEELLQSGMNSMRINCAHDGPQAWTQMVQHLQRARDKLGKPCSIMCDLAGPKLRTGKLDPGPQVLRWKPKRNELGRVVTPARVRLVPPGVGVVADAVVVDEAFLHAVHVRDEVHLTDARGRARKLRVVAIDQRGAVCESKRTAYVLPGISLTLVRHGKKRQVSKIGALPPTEPVLSLKNGEKLVVRYGDEGGHAAMYNDKGTVLKPAVISCPIQHVFSRVKVGQRVLFDDGKFDSVITDVHADHFVVDIKRAGLGTAKLGAEKGINFPDTDLQLPALTDKDRADLDFVAAHADIVALSFVHRSSDILELQRELETRNAGHLAKVLKIETRRAFDSLPELLLTGLQFAPLAVMVARGDLGVEVGFERLAEVQEEMLWLCEAAHVPVIWATQVLESLTKFGLPSRSEVTDAAMGARAECVMLNKGPHVRESVRFLGDVLERMQQHQSKKFPMLRELRVSHLVDRSNL